MHPLIGFGWMFALAAGIGLGATWYSLTYEIPLLQDRIGPWSTRPRIGARDADPYARAQIARSGVLPLAAGDGVGFTARSDDRGEPLDGRCTTLVSGLMPAARYWTLTLYDANGRLMSNPAGRHGFTSAEIVRRADGWFEIVIAEHARPGNWLPTGGAHPYQLVLRLYDTPGNVSSRNTRRTDMPAIARSACP